MKIQAVTTWEGTPKALEMLIEGSKQSGPIHESMGAKNPRLWKASSGGNMEQVYYCIEFDSHQCHNTLQHSLLCRHCLHSRFYVVQLLEPRISWIDTLECCHY